MPFVADEVVTAAKLNLATGLGTADSGASNRTFTNTGFLDLDALTGGAGSISAAAVSIVTGTSVLVIITAGVRNQTAASEAYVGFRVSGATTIAAAATSAIRAGNADVAFPSRTYHTVLSTLNAGTNVFELQAAVTANIGQITTARITVVTIA